MVDVSLSNSEIIAIVLTMLSGALGWAWNHLSGRLDNMDTKLDSSNALQQARAERLASVEMAVGDIRTTLLRIEIKIDKMNGHEQHA